MVWSAKQLLAGDDSALHCTHCKRRQLGHGKEQGKCVQNVTISKCSKQLFVEMGATSDLAHLQPKETCFQQVSPAIETVLELPGQPTMYLESLLLWSRFNHWTCLKYHHGECGLRGAALLILYVSAAREATSVHTRAGAAQRAGAQ